MLELLRAEDRVATVVRVEPVARDTFVYHLRLDAPIRFHPGQFFNLAVPDSGPRGERSYSVYSDPAAVPDLELAIKLLEGGAASEFLRRSRAGDTFKLRGPFGGFTLVPDAEPVTFLATGTGLAPFRPMLEAAARAHDPRRFRLAFGVRDEPDLFGLEHLERLRAALPDFDWTVCLSRAGPGWTGYRGRVTQLLAEEPGPPVGYFYLCGNGAMIEEARTFLKERGVDRKHIHAEKYY